MWQYKDVDVEYWQKKKKKPRKCLPPLDKPLLTMRTKSLSTLFNGMSYDKNICTVRP